MNAIKKVLLVDDSVVSARQLERVIAALGGFQVVGHAKDGAEGVRLFRELSPDIVCMDIVMPVLDGFTALRSMMDHDNRAKVVMVSSMGGAREKVVEALRLGAKSVIAKPFEPDDVKNVLAAL